MQKDKPMASKQYTVKLVKGTNSKTVWITATSPQNAAFEASRQHPGWTVADVRS
jgi:hypothetical protein